MLSNGTRPLRVAHLTTVDSSLRYLLFPQLRAVFDAGGEAIGVSAPGPYVAELEARGIRHVPLRSSTRRMAPLEDLRAAVELWRFLRAERPDVLHTHNPKPGLYGRVVGRLAGVPVVVNTVHGLYATETDPLAKRLAIYALEAVAARFSHAELVQSAEDVRALRRWKIVPASRCRYLGNGIDLTRFDPERFARRRNEIRGCLGLRERDVAVLMIGRLVYEKGYRELFEAARSLPERYVVLCAGHRDPEKPDAVGDDVVADAERRGIRFLGMRDDVEELYAAADVFVLPSYREGFPRAAMEAAAMGVPIVATDIRGCREVVEDGVNGLRIPVRDPSALADAIRRLGEDRDLREEMGRRGRELAVERFDERAVVELVLSTYAAVLERAARRRPRRRALALSAKRAFDVAASGAGLLLLSPLLLGIAVAVRRTSRGPALLVQERPGRDGRVFRLYKYRTMRDARDDRGEPLPDGDRITPLGAFLRRNSLDELPELLNVLNGDMSIVGPRPLLVRYLDRYTPEQRRRHSMRPGVTGWAQINGRNAVSWDERFELDLWYIDHWSLLLDLRILARTIPKVLRHEGISQAGNATMPEFMGSNQRSEASSNGTAAPAPTTAVDAS